MRLCLAYVQGNNFTYSCNAQQSYINDICLPGSAPSPSQLPPLGTTTAGSRTSVSGLPRSNATLPANNASLPGQMVYPGARARSPAPASFGLLSLVLKFGGCLDRLGACQGCCIAPPYISIRPFSCGSD